MKFGMLHLFENPIGTSEHEIVHEQLTLMRAAEDCSARRAWAGSTTGRCWRRWT